ncbi:MAG: PAS domain-containing protein, partial [Sphingomonadales bacterium]
MASLPLQSFKSPRALLPLVAAVAAGFLAAAVVLLTLNDRAIAAGFLAAGILAAGALYGARRLLATEQTVEGPTDWSVAYALAAASDDALAVTDRAGRLVCANGRYEALFAGWPTPPSLPVSDNAVAALGVAARTAWRDGEGRADGIEVFGASVSVRVARAGDESLVWRFIGIQALDLAAQLESIIGGGTGDRLGSAGIMAAMVTPEGRIRAANRVFRARAMGNGEAPAEGRDFARFLITDSSGLVRFEREGLDGTPLRVLQIPFLEGEDTPMLVTLLDEEQGAAVAPAIGASATAHVRSLIALLPSGLALVDRDGRFVSMNDAFVRATRVNAAAPPLYPGDLVVREDKAALADAVRRFAGGAAQSAEMQIRLQDAPEEPVAITIAGARGLGDA